MSDSLGRIRELCATLGACADNLDNLRAEHPVSRVADPGSDDAATLWGGTVGATASKVNGVGFWFDDIEPIYAELDELIRYAPSELCRSVLADDGIQSLAPGIHRVRAAYERDKELVEARNLVQAANVKARLERIIAEESYWAMNQELRAALDGMRHVLVAGSGPLPLTALCIGASLDVRVSCIERDTECHVLGQRLIALSGLADKVECMNVDLLDMTDFDAYDAIVGVVLLGVGIDGQQASSKAAIARHIITHMTPGTRMVLRDPHGLGRLLYPSVALEPSEAVEVTRVVPEVGPTRPYRSGLVIAERRLPDSGHAH